MRHLSRKGKAESKYYGTSDQLQFIILFRRVCASEWGRQNMQDTGERADSSGGYLSQLKSFYRNAFFVRKGLFSGLAFFSFGLTGVLPILPQADPGVFAAKEIPAESRGKNDTKTEERCYWQEDMRLLATLQDKKDAVRTTDVPCEKMIVIEAKAQEIQPLHSDNALGNMIREMTAGYPVEAMAPAIAEYDREVAGLIVGIAKKESNWGKRVPRDAQGNDCFNYWGYKGAGTRGVAMGHGCFGSPEEAVTTIGDRLQELVALRKTSEPKNMIIWKCGSSCSGHSAESVQKWIADVSLYYDRIASK